MPFLFVVIFMSWFNNLAKGKNGIDCQHRKCLGLVPGFGVFMFGCRVVLVLKRRLPAASPLKAYVAALVSA